MENIGAAIRGMYRDVLLDARQQVIHDSGWVSNTIVERGRSLLAAFMKGDSGASGIRYMAIGQGVEAWDTKPQAPDPSATGLVNPYTYHVEFNPDDILYLGDHDEVSSTLGVPTRRLQIRATWGNGLPLNQTCALREFGLFGQFGGAPFMINSVRHPLIQKAASDTLIRVVHLYF